MGYKSEQFVNKVDEHLICPICHEVFQDPVSCKDGHTFCSDCIEKWLKSSNKCPLDNGVITDHKLVRNYIASGIIDNLEVYCQSGSENNDTIKDNAGDKGTEKNCIWTGKLQELAKHMDSCLFQKVECPYQGCTEKIQKRAIDKHKKNCNFKSVVCTACRVTLIQNDAKNHFEYFCPKSLVPCPKSCIMQGGQIAKFRRMDLDNHLATICPKEKVDCPFKEQGCFEQVERQHVDKHVQENMSTHVMLLAKQNTQLKDELNKVKESLSKSRGSYIWKIDHFKYLEGSESPVFLECGHKWKLWLTKKKISPVAPERDGSITFHLIWLGNINGSVDPDAHILTFVRLSVLSTIPGDTDYTVSQSRSFTKLNNTLEFRYVLKLEDALSPAYCGKDKSLKVLCTIQVCFSE